MSNETKIYMASIVSADHLSATSKYTLITHWIHPQSGIPLAAAFNINADVVVPAFMSTDAPDQQTLSLEWTTDDQFLGFDEFSGEIGAGRIYIRTGKGIKVKGVIVGGPAGGQSFVGAGTWTRA
ncbi:hypothetical protein FRC10_001552 [Ceratobasidium sp. 414]|nr:hypothetical protein FRC10_001552 [Ceratobasidium sp. 414]